MKMCIFFGAGSEIPFGISGGKDFAKGVLGIGRDDLNGAITEYYCSKKKDLLQWYPNYVHWEWDNERLIRAAVKKEILENQIALKDTNDYENEVNRRIKEVKDSKEEDEVISKYTSYMGLLDKYFHTLIAPRALGPKKFWCVVECYTRAYLILAAEMLYGNVSEVKRRDYVDILRNPIQTLQKMNDICNQTRFQERSYYSILRGRDNIKIVTTNYTPCCKQITGYPENRIAYVHGRFGQFEDPYTWNIIDVGDTENKVAFKKGHVYFPYISIQSGIKPIIEESQILEYSKMIQAFDESDKIIIVGYRINSDDNHINAMLQSCIKKGKEVVYLAYKGEPVKEQIVNRLRLSKECVQKLVWKEIGYKDSLDIFERELG